MRVQPPREDLIELPQLNPLERFPDGRPHVPEGPGLGFALNEDAVRAHLVPDGQSFFEPAPEWDAERCWDRLWSEVQSGHSVHTGRKGGTCVYSGGRLRGVGRAGVGVMRRACVLA